jgi:hypothetical protein
MSLIHSTLNSTRKHVGQWVAVREMYHVDPNLVDQDAPCEVCRLTLHRVGNDTMECTSCLTHYHQRCMTWVHHERHPGGSVALCTMRTRRSARPSRLPTPDRVGGDNLGEQEPELQTIPFLQFIHACSAFFVI